MAVSANINTLRRISDAVANDSDKTITVGSGDAYRILYGTFTLASTATVGNRQLDVIISDESANVMYIMSTGAVQAASLTRAYKLQPGSARSTAFTGTTITLDAAPADIVLLPDWTIRIADTAAIDAAADDLTIHMLVEVLF